MQRLSLLFILSALLFVPAGAATSEKTKEVARNLVCLCGDCNRESLATCVCGYAASQREVISTALDAGTKPEKIIAQFVGTYGSVVMAIPPRKGYNLLAWIVPIAIMVIGGLILRSVLLGWRRDHRSSDPDKADPPVQEDAGTDAYKDRLRRDLNNFDPS